MPKSETNPKFEWFKVQNTFAKFRKKTVRMQGHIISPVGFSAELMGTLK
jgi:hypothetical protein